MISVHLSSPYLEWDWSIDIPPTEKIVIQPKPTPATLVNHSSGTVKHTDLAFEAFRELGMGDLSPGQGAGAVMGVTDINTITCRLDGDGRLTIVVSAVASENMEIPHDEPSLTKALSHAGRVLFLVTSDSLDDERAMDLQRFIHDVSSGGVLGATIPVVDERPYAARPPD